MKTWSHTATEQRRSQRWLNHWNLLIALVSRDIRARYRRTLLGPLWAIIPAILATLIYSFLGDVVGVDSEGAPRLVFVFAATVPWTYLQSSIVRIPHGVLANGNLLRKMSIPRLIFPLVVLLTTFFDFCMNSIVLIITLQLFGIPVTLEWLWLPILIIQLNLLAIAVGFGICAFSVYRRDMLHGIQHLMQVWLFLTPVIYSSSDLKDRLSIVHTLNPAVGIIDGFRKVLVFGEAPDLGLLGMSLLISLLIMIISVPLYQMMSQYFADVL